MSERLRTAIVTGAVGLGIVVLVRVAMRVAFAGYVSRIAARRETAEVASLRTRYTILSRLVLAILLVIVAWSVLEVFPTTRELARSLLASGAVLTLFVGIALSGPLTNIGAGVLLGLSQSVRLGDRVTIGDVTGTATEITLLHTILHTDEGRRVFVPNSQMTSSIITNRSIDDPRRTVSIRLPIDLRGSVDSARQAVVAAVEGVEGCTPADCRVALDDLTEKTAWLTLTVHLPPGTDVAGVAAELRERALAALAREELLPR